MKASLRWSAIKFLLLDQDELVDISDVEEDENVEYV
jgi:hypothetical protein